MGARLALNSWFCPRVLPLIPWQRWNYGQAPPCSAFFSTVCRSLSWVGTALDKAKGYLKKLSQNPSNKFSLKQLQCRVFSKTVQEVKIKGVSKIYVNMVILLWNQVLLCVTQTMDHHLPDSPIHSNCIVYHLASQARKREILLGRKICFRRQFLLWISKVRHLLLLF